jgi:hypothetical protein
MDYFVGITRVEPISYSAELLALLVLSISELLEFVLR